MILKYALIGCGRIAPNHIAAALDSDVSIIALCDLDANKAIDLAKQFNLKSDVKIYTDYKKMIEEESLDMVAIATESGYHAEIALNCIEKQINLIIEKPIALSLFDADLIIDRAKKKNVIVSACHQNRFNKAVQHVKQALDQDHFGKLFHGTAHIRWNRGKDYYLQAPWRGTWRQDGGALMNQCIHNIDLLRWLMGNDIEEVFAYTKNFNHPYIEAEDLGVALVKFKNGSLGMIEGTTNIYPKNLEETLYIFGEKGTFKAGGKSVNKIEEWHFKDDHQDPEFIKQTYSENPPNVYGFGHIPLYKDVVDAIKHGRNPYVTAEDGRRALELVLAIYESSHTGKPVSLPLRKGSTLDYEVKEVK